MPRASPSTQRIFAAATLAITRQLGANGSSNSLPQLEGSVLAPQCPPPLVDGRWLSCAWYSHTCGARQHRNLLDMATLAGQLQRDAGLPPRCAWARVHVRVRACPRLAEDISLCPVPARCSFRRAAKALFVMRTEARREDRRATGPTALLTFKLRLQYRRWTSTAEEIKDKRPDDHGCGAVARQDGPG
eukprot:6683759-Prymnesium_polylepis.1